MRRASCYYAVFAASPNEPLPPAAALRPLDSQTAVTEGLGRNRGLHVSVDDEGNLHHAGLEFEREVSVPSQRAARHGRFYCGRAP